MTPANEGAKMFGPYAYTLTAEEADAASTRFGLRLALAGGLTARHQAPLAAFVLALLFASILALTGLISRRAGEIAILLAAMAFMLQRLATHWRLQSARTRGRAVLAQLRLPLTAALDEAGVMVEGAARPVATPYEDLEEAEDNGELVYLWPKAGAPIVVPARTLAEGEAARLVTEVRRRIAAVRT